MELRDCDRDRWVALGETLIRKRVELSHRYANRSLFGRERNVTYRVLYDIENAKRQDFSAPMIILIEHAYGLPIGFIRSFLTGQTLPETEPEPAAA
jgi:hypothetical protein